MASLITERNNLVKDVINATDEMVNSDKTSASAYASDNPKVRNSAVHFLEAIGFSVRMQKRFNSNQGGGEEWHCDIISYPDEFDELEFDVQQYIASLSF